MRVPQQTPARCAFRTLILAVGLVAVGALAGCARVEANEESLRDSFAERIATSDFVADFSRDGDELTFTGPDSEGGTAAWRVLIDTSLVEPRMFDEAMPFEGRVTSEWHVNGEIVEYLGTMTALPKKFLDRGLGQECWAFWMEAERRWDW